MLAMDHMTDTILGFDPGKKNRFGAGVLAGSTLSTVTVSTVAEAAIESLVRECSALPEPDK